MGAVTRVEPNEDSRTIRFFVFDLIENRTQQIDRLRKLSNIMHEVFTERKSPRLVFVQSCLCIDQQESDEMHRSFLEHNYEGTIYRPIHASYAYGRRILYKRKALQDDEVTVIGITDGMGKFDGMMGAFIVQDKKGHIFNVGGGNMTEKDRLAFKQNPPINSRITIEFPYRSSKGIPLQSQFRSIRPAGV